MNRRNFPQDDFEKNQVEGEYCAEYRSDEERCKKSERKRMTEASMSHCCMCCCPCCAMMMMHHSMSGHSHGMMSQRGEMTRQQPCSGFQYTVQLGDTLFTIAQRYKVSLSDLLAANPQIANPNAIAVGQTICVPGVMPLPTPVECTTGELYTVRIGDTLTAIARRFNTTVSEIVAANPIITNPNNLVVGWNLCIPVEEPTPPECTGTTYTVRIGDTLTAIARRFNTTVSTILAANPIITDPNNLVVGWNLCIPLEEPTPPECPGVTYTIRSGDTLTAIARRFNTTVSAILAANPLISNPDNLIVGLNICIPSGCSGQIYVVRLGDTLSIIAQRAGISYQALIQANPQITNPNQLFVGQKICIPRR